MSVRCVQNRDPRHKIWRRLRGTERRDTLDPHQVGILAASTSPWPPVAATILYVGSGRLPPHCLLLANERHPDYYLLRPFSFQPCYPTLPRLASTHHALGQTTCLSIHLSISEPRSPPLTPTTPTTPTLPRSNLPTSFSCSSAIHSITPMTRHPSV